jgi:hypothetical protein
LHFDEKMSPKVPLNAQRVYFPARLYCFPRLIAYGSLETNRDDDEKKAALNGSNKERHDKFG